ncbi:MAG TPA: hypothetical protein VJZ00_07380 [Thermoanaerobaculia bacterium]|nr:hypothetical protein [Thermoanaerobaculia bacterium]
MAKRSQGEWLVLALLALLTFAVYAQVASHQFLNYDDGQSIYENAHVRRGLDPTSVAWALTSAELGWYPLTWLSHMAGVELWGIRAGMHLLLNALLHLASACLLFLALRRLAISRWASAFVAALFAVHPMHVESVAWASERKDTLSTLFILLALLFYASDPSRKTRVALAMAASLASKQMYVTFPVVLLLLDFWPLNRLRDLRARVLEKLPLFALSIAGSAIAFLGQRNLHALRSTAMVPLPERFANASVAYCRYLGKLFLPVKLALPYPWTPIATTTAIAAALLLVAITIVCVRLAKRAPWLVTGWLWFVIVLIPVIGIVQIGAQPLADRYTYFAYIGLFLAIACSIPQRALPAIATALVLACTALAYRQVGYWKNSETLFAHAIAVTPPNAQAHYLLGQTLELTDPDRAIPELRNAISLVNAPATPDWYAQAFVGIGSAELTKARAMPPTSPARETLIVDAQSQFRRALQIDANAEHAQNNLAVAELMLAQGRASAHVTRAVALSQQQRFDEALVEYRNAVAAFPTSAEPHVYLALGLLQAKQPREAAQELLRAKQLDATAANALITSALRLPPDARNLDAIAAQLARR